MNNELLEAARKAVANAYAPYSGYPVGAALHDEHGQVWQGCNVENVSYGLTVCAERNAVFAMVAGGGRRVQELLVLTADGGTPCGACLQVLSEFANPNLPIHIATVSGVLRTTSLGDLLPVAFRSGDVNSNAT